MSSCCVPFQCLHTVFSATSVLTPLPLTPPPGNMDVSVLKFCIYVFIFLYICVCCFVFFRHGYLLHNVVCINTIIYFSMGGRGRDEKRQKNHRLGSRTRWDSLVHLVLLGWGRNWYPANKRKNGIFNFPRIHSHVIFHFLLPTLIWSYWFFFFFWTNSMSYCMNVCHFIESLPL